MTGRSSDVVARTCTLGAFQVHSNRNACIPHPASSTSKNSWSQQSFRRLLCFHGFVVHVGAGPSSQGTNSVIVSCGFPEPVGISLLCCAHVGPSPLFEQSPDRRMGWSKFDEPGSSNWQHQRCRLQKWRSIPSSPWFRCGIVLHMELDCRTSQRWMWCSQSHSRGRFHNESRFFVYGSLTRMGPLYCWKDGPMTVLGQGTQSWKLCHIMSLALAVSAHDLGVSVYSTGPRHPFPYCQQLYRMSSAGDLVPSPSAHLQSLDPQSTPCAGCAVQCWLGWWRTSVRSSPRNGHSTAHRCRFGFVVGGTVWWVLSLSATSPGPVAAPTSPSIAGDSTAVNFPIPRPFGQQLMDSQRLATRTFQDPHFRQSYCDMWALFRNPSFLCTSPNVGRSQAQTVPPPPLTEGGPLVRLTRFIANASGRVLCLLSVAWSTAGQFQDLGRASVRLEGSTAWRVGLRVDEWSTAPGRRARLWCGVLHQLANRTLCFHGVAAWCGQISVAIVRSMDLSMGSRCCPQCGAIIHRRFWTDQSCARTFHSDRVVQRVLSRMPTEATSQHWIIDYRKLAPHRFCEKRCRVSVLKWDPSSCAVCRVWTLVNGPPWTSDDVLLRSMIHQLIDVCHTIQQHLPSVREEMSTLQDPSDQIIFFSFYEESSLKCVTFAPFFQFSEPKSVSHPFRDIEISNLFSQYFSFEYLISDFWILFSFWFSLSCMLHSLFKYMSVFENVHRFWILKM